MRRFLVIVSVALAVTLSAGSALGASIDKKFGVTGRVGFLFPSDSDYRDLKLEGDVALVGGGGVIFGLTKKVDVDFDITYTWFSASRPSSGRDAGDFETTNFSFGAHYRFEDPYLNLTPYAGGGLSVLMNDFENADVDTVVGVHIDGGFDYFITKDIAINAQLRAVIAPEADIMPGRPIIDTPAGLLPEGGHFDPSSISGQLGVRYFF